MEGSYKKIHLQIKKIKNEREPPKPEPSYNSKQAVHMVFRQSRTRVEEVRAADIGVGGAGTAAPAAGSLVLGQEFAAKQFGWV